MRTLTKETTDRKQQRIVCLFLPGSGIRLYASQLSCQQSTEVQALAGRPRVAKVSAAANALETGQQFVEGSNATLHLLQLAPLAMLANRVTRLT